MSFKSSWCKKARPTTANPAQPMPQYHIENRTKDNSTRDIHKSEDIQTAPKEVMIKEYVIATNQRQASDEKNSNSGNAAQPEWNERNQQLRDKSKELTPRALVTSMCKSR